MGNQNRGPSLDRLSSLVSGAKKMSPEEQAEAEADEAKVMADVKKVLDYAAKIIPGGMENIFGMQMVIELAAEEIREQIRDMVEGDEDDDE